MEAGEKSLRKKRFDVDGNPAVGFTHHIEGNQADEETTRIR